MSLIAAFAILAAAAAASPAADTGPYDIGAASDAD